MLDVGANFGLFALACARALQPLDGAVHAWEGQRMLSYMIAGSAALNSLENLFVYHACVGNSTDPVPIPRFDYFQPMNFGSVEFGATQLESLDQKRQVSTESVQQVRLDDLSLENVCLMKIDVEGMEETVLDGCVETIERSRPIVLIEYLKSDASQLAEFFRERKYVVHVYNGDFLCIPRGQTINGLNNALPEYVPGTKMERI
jgi:FkbM family methyltransferase